jgi:hypothetical protein
MKIFYPMKKLLFLISLITGALEGFSQTEGEPRLINFNFQLKNMHYWRGFAVTTAPMLGSNLYYQSPNEHWNMGVWGGMGFNGV